MGSQGKNTEVVCHSILQWRTFCQTSLLDPSVLGGLILNMLLEISGEITPERMKEWNQSKKNTQLWMSLVIEARSDAVKSNIA